VLAVEAAVRALTGPPWHYAFPTIDSVETRISPLQIVRNRLQPRRGKAGLGTDL